MQISVSIMLFGLLLELVEFSEAYKISKPYKHYYPLPWRPPRWHSFPKPQKFYRPKRRPPKYHSYDPDYHRYAPSYEDTVDTYDAGKPYVIIIQLPEKKEKNKHGPHKRHHIVSDPHDDYTDNDDKVKVYQLDNDTVRIKVNDRLSVLTS